MDNTVHSADMTLTQLLDSAEPKQLPPVIDKRDAEIARLNKLIERLEAELERYGR